MGSCGRCNEFSDWRPWQIKCHRQPERRRAFHTCRLFRSRFGQGCCPDGQNNPVSNAEVRLSASSIFGGDDRTRTAGLDGTFIFDGVFIGSFYVSAKTLWPVSAAGSGNITVSAVVELTLRQPNGVGSRGMSTAQTASPSWPGQASPALPPP